MEFTDRQLEALLSRLDRLVEELARMNRRQEGREELTVIAHELRNLNESLQALAYAALGQRRPPATTGLVPPLALHAFWSRAPRRTHASSAPSVATKTHFPRQTAGALKRPPAVGTVCSSPPLTAFVPGRRRHARSRSFPSLPPCTA